MALSYAKYTGTGATTQFPITFPYIDASHIFVSVDGADVAFTPDVINQVVTLSSAPAIGKDIRVYRFTPRNKTYSDFSRGNALGQRNMNNSFLWQLYISQEIAEGGISPEFVMNQDLNMGGNKIINMFNGVDDQDAVTVSQLNNALANVSTQGVVPIIQPRQIGVSGKSQYDTPATKDASPASFRISIDGLLQSPVTDYTTDTIGKVDFINTVPVGAEIDIVYFEPKVVTSIPLTYNSIAEAKANEASIDVGSLITIKNDVGKGYQRYVVELKLSEGSKDTPDYLMLSSSKRAVLVKDSCSKFTGTFSSPSQLGHRAGQFAYKKFSNTEAVLLTDLSKYIPYTLEDKDDSSLTVVYADWGKGNDNSGDGLSWANAKGSIQSALNLNPDILLIKAGQYNRVNRLTDFDVTKDLSIISVGGSSQVSMMATGTWSADTRTNVYKLTYASGLTNTTSRVFDADFITHKTATIYQPVSSADEVEQTAGSWWHDSANNITYIRAVDNRDLTLYGEGLRLTQNVAQSKITFKGNYKLYFEGLEFWGGSGQLEFKSDGSTYTNSVFYGKNCKYNGNTDGNGNGFAVRDIGLSISDSCESSLNRRDGFNYHFYKAGQTGVAGLSPHFVEINCNAHNNGVDGSEGNNQGSTAHEECVGFRIGGDYSYHKDGGCVVDIESVNCLMVSNICCESTTVGALLSADRTYPETARWWVDGMVAVNNSSLANGRGDLSIDGYNSKLYIRDVLSDNYVSVRNFSKDVEYSW